MCALFFVGGCQTTGPYSQKFKNIVFDDGINQAEAVAIAQNTLRNDHSQRSGYKMNRVEVIDDFLVDPYPDYWFISFPSGEFDLSFYQYLVVVHKKTGNIVFSAPYVPLKTVDYDWVFSQ